MNGGSYSLEALDWIILTVILVSGYRRSLGMRYVALMISLGTYTVYWYNIVLLVNAAGVGLSI